jgi:hypothetical protein
MKLFTKREPFVTPTPTLIKRFWYIISPNALSNNSPDSLDCATLKKEMRHTFFLITEVASWTANPLPSQHVVFGQDDIVQD